MSANKMITKTPAGATQKARDEELLRKQILEENKKPAKWATQVEQLDEAKMARDLEKMGKKPEEVLRILGIKEKLKVDGTAQPLFTQTGGMHVAGTGVEEPKKKRAPRGQARYQALVIVEGKNWALFDPVHKGYPEGLPTPPAAITRWEHFQPGNRRVILLNIATNSLLSMATPENLKGKTVDYTPTGPKVANYAPLKDPNKPTIPEQQKANAAPPLLGRGARRTATLAACAATAVANTTTTAATGRGTKRKAEADPPALALKTEPAPAPTLAPAPAPAPAPEPAPAPAPAPAKRRKTAATAAQEAAPVPAPAAPKKRKAAAAASEPARAPTKKRKTAAAAPAIPAADPAPAPARRRKTTAAAPAPTPAPAPAKKRKAAAADPEPAPAPAPARKRKTTVAAAAPSRASKRKAAEATSDSLDPQGPAPPATEDDSMPPPPAKKRRPLPPPRTLPPRALRGKRLPLLGEAGSLAGTEGTTVKVEASGEGPEGAPQPAPPKTARKRGGVRKGEGTSDGGSVGAAEGKERKKRRPAKAKKTPATVKEESGEE